MGRPAAPALSAPWDRQPCPAVLTVYGRVLLTLKEEWSDGITPLLFHPPVKNQTDRCYNHAQ